MSKIINLSTYYYLKGEIDTLLNGKANSVHTHDDRYYTETEVDTKLSGKSDTSHNHDDRYLKSVPSHTDSNGAYGKATTGVWGHTKLNSATNSTDETTAATPKAVKAAYDLANGKANASHTHDDRYYTETEINEVFDELNDVDVFTGTNKSIAQTGDTIYLTGTLFGDDIEGKTIQFYNGNTLLGSSITNAYGSAVYQYNCTGAGKKEITTKYGSVVSEPCNVIDALFFDDASTNRSSEYSLYHCNLSHNNGEYTITRNGDGECYVDFVFNTSKGNLSEVAGKTIRFECEIISSDATMRLITYQYTTRWSATNGADATSGALSVPSTAIGGVTIDNTATAIQFRISANNLGSNQTLKFKNFKLYVV